MAHRHTTSTLIHAPGETIADALTDLTKITRALISAAYDPDGRPSTGLAVDGVLVVRRGNSTVVGAWADPEVPAGEFRSEHLLDVVDQATRVATLPAPFPYFAALPDVFELAPAGKGGDA